MARIYIVRHGQAAAGWGEDADPPLSELGKEQAEAVSKLLQESVAEINSFDIVSSPIRRARETSIPLCQALGKEATIETRVAEIPSPIDDVQDRLPWLMEIMKDNWNNLSPELNQWRQECLDYLASIKNDTIIFSHFIAINVAVGDCQNDDRVICFKPDNTSVTELNNEGQKLTLVSLGEEANTKVN